MTETVRRNRRLALIGLAVVLALGALAGLAHVWSVYQENKVLADHGITIQATVSDKTATAQGRSGTLYQIFYRFTPAGGGPTEGSDEVSSDAYDRLQVGQQVSVRYLPETPQTTRLLDPGHTDDFAITLVVSVLFLVAPLVLVYFVLTGKGPLA